MEVDHNETVHVAPSGDLKLLVDYENEDSESTLSKIIVVSSTVLCLASPVWRAMFDPQGHFMEAKQSGSREVHLADDDPKALLILLDIAHLNFERVPSALSFDELLKVSVLCDKYDTVNLVHPWASNWIQALCSSHLNPGFEEWLFIDWTFGEESAYKSLSVILVGSIKTDESGQVLNSEGNPLGQVMPPGAVDALLDARKWIIEALLVKCYALVDFYASSTNVCYLSGPGQPSEEAEECDALILGCLMRGLYRCGIWPKTAPSDIRPSFFDLLIKLYQMTCQSKGSRHNKCKFTEELKRTLDRIYNERLTGVLDSHCQHLAEQAKKRSIFDPRT